MAVVPQDSVRSHSSSTPAGTRPPARRTLWLSHRSRPTSCQPPARARPAPAALCIERTSPPVAGTYNVQSAGLRNALFSQRLGAPERRPALVERHGRSRRRTRSAAASEPRRRWQGGGLRQGLRRWQWSREPPHLAFIAFLRTQSLLHLPRAQICTGVTTVANSPFGAYAAEGIITVTFPKITDLLKVPFTRKLKDGPDEPFKEGAFEGSHFIPKPRPAGFTDRLDIQWCPNQNYFQVKVEGVDGSNTLVYTPSCDSSWSVSPPRACMSCPHTCA